MKKILFCLTIFIFIFSLASPVFADGKAAYKLDNGYIAVREDVFNSLTTNDKLVDELKKEVDYYKSSIAELKTLNTQKDEIQGQRITVLKDTITLKDQIIEYKNATITDYDKLYKNEKAINSKFRAKNLLEKLCLIALTGYACSQIDDTGAKCAVGAAGAALVFYGN